MDYTEKVHFYPTSYTRCADATYSILQSNNNVHYSQQGIGHTQRKAVTITTRQALNWNPQGKRKRGRPRNSWRRDTEALLKQQGYTWTRAAATAQR